MNYDEQFLFIFILQLLLFSIFILKFHALNGVSAYTDQLYTVHSVQSCFREIQADFNMLKIHLLDEQSNVSRLCREHGITLKVLLRLKCIQNTLYFIHLLCLYYFQINNYLDW